ncbi:CaiB/BaiF CoA transferase family protein [Chloroflexota bacterium]
MEAETMLAPYRALDLTGATGVLCGKMLADLGADVIKIEKPGGDPARNLGPFYQDVPDPEKSLFWFASNTSKRGVTLNIESKQGQEIFKGLVKSADFILESFPPGYMKSLNLGYEELSHINPKIIMTSITPFGQTGPYKDFKSSDIVALAMSGFMCLCGDYDRPPLRFTIEQSYTQAGAQAAAASMIALHHRQLTGQGQWADVSIQECLLTASFMVQSTWDLIRITKHREGSRTPRGRIAPKVIFECQDGYVSWRVFVADQGKKANALVDMMEEWGETEPEVREVDFTKIDMNDIIQEELESWEEGFSRFFAKHSKAELHREAVKRDLMLFPVNSIEDLLNDEQLGSRKFWTDIEHPELNANITYPGAPFKSVETPWRVSRRPPLIGEHNQEIYGKELGLSKEELRLLKEQGVI